jgi:Na+/H+ antiporter NhaB
MTSLSFAVSDEWYKGSIVCVGVLNWIVIVRDDGVQAQVTFILFCLILSFACYPIHPSGKPF